MFFKFEKVQNVISNRIKSYKSLGYFVANTNKMLELCRIKSKVNSLSAGRLKVELFNAIFSKNYFKEIKLFLFKKLDI